MILQPGRRDLLGLFGGAALAATLPHAAGAADKPRALRIANRANPSTLDPFTGNSGSDHVTLFAIYATLVDWDPATLQARPGIAESWEYTDPTTLVLKLHPNVLFHDGTRCDAEAVKFNLERGMTATRSTVKADLGSIASVETQGDSVVVVKLKRPDTSLVLALSDRAGMMVSPKAVKEATGATGIDRTPVGAGPWKFVSWVDHAKIALTRNEQYFRSGLPRADGLDFAIIPELNTGLRSVIAGENDLVFRLEPPQKIVADRSKNLTTVMGPTLYVHQMYFNLSRPPFNDKRIRQAMNYAVDREAFNKATLLGLGEPAFTALPKSHWAHDPSLDGIYPHDPAKARKLLAEAGVSGMLNVLVLGFSDQTAQQRQEVLIEQFAKANIKLTVQRGTVADMSALYFGPEKKGDVNLSSWTGRPDPSMTYNLMFSKDGYYNTGHVQLVPELPEALAATQASADLEQRRAAFARVQRLVAENALHCPLVFDPEIDAHLSTVKGFGPNLLGKPKFEEVSLS